MKIDIIDDVIDINERARIGHRVLRTGCKQRGR
jgi:hypothetical protein